MNGPRHVAGYGSDMKINQMSRSERESAVEVSNSGCVRLLKVRSVKRGPCLYLENAGGHLTWIGRDRALWLIHELSGWLAGRDSFYEPEPEPEPEVLTFRIEF